MLVRAKRPSADPLNILHTSLNERLGSPAAACELSPPATSSGSGRRRTVVFIKDVKKKIPENIQGPVY
ncbi:unannotated protein [freshwater metagenome]|uniref:Unannotated protein n=1 Tax=freshwater metagenome TaxID=449393 RepID=A0A6J6UC88_9ZZZZ